MFPQMQIVLVESSPQIFPGELCETSVFFTALKKKHVGWLKHV